MCVLPFFFVTFFAFSCIHKDFWANDGGLHVNSVGVSRNSSARRAKLNMITRQDKDYKRRKFFLFSLTGIFFPFSLGGIVVCWGSVASPSDLRGSNTTLVVGGFILLLFFFLVVSGMSFLNCKIMSKMEE